MSKGVLDFIYRETPMLTTLYDMIEEDINAYINTLK